MICSRLKLIVQLTVIHHRRELKPGKKVYMAIGNSQNIFDLVKMILSTVKKKSICGISVLITMLMQYAIADEVTFTKHYDIISKKLTTTIVDEITSQSIFACIVFCRSTSNCVSMNYYPGEDKCQLLGLPAATDVYITQPNCQTIDLNVSSFIFLSQFPTLLFGIVDSLEFYNVKPFRAVIVT